MATLPPASQEQQVAVDIFKTTKSNLIISAMAGSGKTTTVLHLCKANPEIKFLLLVYNRRLMVETGERAEALGLTNLIVFNYHTLGARFYTAESATDQGLKRIVENDMSVMAGCNLPDFSCLIMDEQQDMTPILKRFVDKIIRDKGFALQRRQRIQGGDQLRLTVLGDVKQELYSFNNSDARFLSLAHHKEIFGYVNDSPWVEAPQTFSNRITQPNANFIAEQLLKNASGEMMRAVRKARPDGTALPRPRYVITSPEGIIHEVTRLLQHCDVSEILILAASTRMRSAVSVANGLALINIPVHRADSDVSDVPAAAIAGRILLCTYHQAKGIERRACIVMNFDSNYHAFFNKRADAPSIISNPQYVAATRAVEYLVLIQDPQSAPLPFVDLNTLGETCDVVGMDGFEAPPEIASREKSTNRRLQRFQVSQLCRNLSETLITACLERLELCNVINPAYSLPAPPSMIPDKYGLQIGVSNVTGTAVPAIFQSWLNNELSFLEGKKLTILEQLESLLRPTKLTTPNPLRELPSPYLDELSRLVDKVGAGKLDVSEILFVATFATARIDKDITKILAIPLESYNWMSDSYADHLISTLKFLPKPANTARKRLDFEKSMNRKFIDIVTGGGPINPTTKSGIILAGSLDIAHGRKDRNTQEVKRTVWEVKHMDTLQPEHLLQTALYMLLQGPESSGFLVSARTGQTVQIIPQTTSSLLEILQILVGAKSGGQQSRLLNDYSDDEFLAEARSDFAGLIGKCALPEWFSASSAVVPKKRRRKKKSKNTQDKEANGQVIVAA